VRSGRRSGHLWLTGADSGRLAEKIAELRDELSDPGVGAAPEPEDGRRADGGCQQVTCRLKPVAAPDSVTTTLWTSAPGPSAPGAATTVPAAAVVRVAV
jgi:hypothetical protein